MIMVVITVGFLYAALETTGDLGSGITVLFFTALCKCGRKWASTWSVFGHSQVA